MACVVAVATGVVVCMMCDVAVCVFIDRYPGIHIAHRFKNGKAGGTTAEAEIQKPSTSPLFSLREPVRTEAWDLLGGSSEEAKKQPTCRRHRVLVLRRWV